MATMTAAREKEIQGREPRPEKVQAVSRLQSRFAQTSSLVLFDYRGLTVSQMTALRQKTRKAGVELSVVKNSILKRAVEDTPFSVIGGHLTGPISIATTSGDPASPAKVLSDFLRGLEVGKITGAVVDGRFLEASEVKRLAELPSREVLLALLLGTLQGPVASLPRTLNAIVLKLLYALQAIAKKKEI